MKNRVGILLFVCAVNTASVMFGQTATWDIIQTSILDNNCTGCHAAGSPFATQSGLVLTDDVAYSQLVGLLPMNTAARGDSLLRVSADGGAPGVAQSFLWEKINAPGQEHFYEDHPGYGAIMPLGGLPLTNGELEYVKRWILEGAPQTGAVVDPTVLDDNTRYEPAEFAPLAVPENGIQLHLGPFDVWPSEVNDREFLYYQPLETTEDLYVNRYEISYREGSHHFIAYNYPEGMTTPEPEVFRDIRDQNGVPDFQHQSELSQLFPFQFFVGTQTPRTDYSLPEGVALRLPAGSGFDLNVHSVNRTGETRQGEVYVNLHTLDAAEVEHVADYANFGNYDIELPPNQETTLTETFTFAETRHVIQVWSHSHEHTEWFRIEHAGGENDGELIYWTNDWEHPALLQFNDDPLTFEAGDQVRLITKYNNTTNETINYGPLSTDEMQFMFYIYYTGELTPDLPGDGNGDGWVDGLDYLLWAAAYGSHPGVGAGASTGDYNNDGSVDGLDYLMWAGNYGSHTATSVPEPATVTGLLVGLVGMLAVGRRRRSSLLVTNNNAAA